MAQLPLVGAVVDSVLTSLGQLIRLLACAAHAPAVLTAVHGTYTLGMGLQMHWTALAMPNSGTQSWPSPRVKQYRQTSSAILPAMCHRNETRGGEGNDVVWE
jgi:hypothetical protein